MYPLLIENTKNYVQFSEKEIEHFCSLFYPQKIGKKHFIHKQGSICKFEAFVTKGCFKIFTLNKDGKEHILYFAVKDWWITDMDSFTNQVPSLLSIQALEDSEVLLITKEDKERLYNDIPKSEKLFRKMSQKALIKAQWRIISNHSQTADERYIQFMDRYPQIAQHLTNIQLASYLGISHEFLSKIRKKIAQQGK